MKTLRPRTSTSPSAPAPVYTPSSSGKKRKVGGCGQCEACARDDCRQCVYCKDMRKYGGPNKLRKRCVVRRCQAREQLELVKSEEKKEKPEARKVVTVEEPIIQRDKSKRVIKQPKKLTPNHSAALSYDENVGGEAPKPSSPPAAAPPAKRRKLDVPKKPFKPEPAVSAPHKSYGSGKRLAPPPSYPTRVPSPPNLPHPPSPIVTRVTRRAVRPPLRNTRSASKNKKRRFVPKSLPFLVHHTDIAGVIVRYEIRARNIAVRGLKEGEKENGGKGWRLEEVINFFRGVYLFGWDEWIKVQRMIKTKTVTQTELFANAKLLRFPELKRFFGRNNLAKLHKSFPNEKVKRLASAVSVPAHADIVDFAATGYETSSDQGLTHLCQAVLEVLGDEADAAKDNEQAKAADDAEDEDDALKEPDWLKYSAPPFLIRPMDPTRGTFSNGRVAICLGGRVIETDNKGVTQTESNKPTDSSAPSKPDVFNPMYRPSAPTANSQQIYIPGNRVYARWLNSEDPGSYGTWYPGFVQSSMVSPDQSDYDAGLCEFPTLVYQVRFDDGVLSNNIRSEDIMMQNQYETWLRELEEYYFLPMPIESSKKCLSGGERIHAKWIDPTDPDMHARWIRGVIVACNGLTEDGTFTYHVKFDDGDDDEELSSEYVLEDSIYKELLQQKIEHGIPNVSGIDLIQAVSKISSPIRKSLSTSMNGSSGGALIPDLKDDDDEKSYTTVESELFCHEELGPPSINPNTCDADAPSLHYGLYMTMKPSAITPFIDHPKNIAIHEEPSPPSADDNDKLVEMMNKDKLAIYKIMTGSMEASNAGVQKRTDEDTGSKPSDRPTVATFTNRVETLPSQAASQNHNDKSEPSKSNGSHVTNTANPNTDQMQLTKEPRAAPQAASPKQDGTSNGNGVLHFNLP